jgi:hypothetical protein
MPRVKFSKEFYWRAKDNVRIRYSAGKTYLVTTKCKSDASKAGALEKEPANVQSG